MLENEQKNIEIRHKEELAEVHKEVEEKVTLLLHQLRGMDVKGTLHFLFPSSFC